MKLESKAVEKMVMFELVKAMLAELMMCKVLALLILLEEEE